MKKEINRLTKKASYVTNNINVTVTDGEDEWEEYLPIDDLDGLELVGIDWKFKDAISTYSLDELNDLANTIENLSADEEEVFYTYLQSVEEDVKRALQIAESGDYSIYEDCLDVADFGGEFWSRNVDDIGIELPDYIDSALSACMDWERFGNYIMKFINSGSGYVCQSYSGDSFVEMYL